MADAKKVTWQNAAAACLWLIPLVVVLLLVARAPGKHTVTHVYHRAVENWLNGKSLYSSQFAFHYFPSFIPVFLPFHLLPVPLGDLLWRALSLGLVFWGTRGLIRLLPLLQTSGAMLCASLVAIGPCIGALRNGQANLALAGLLALAAVQLAKGRWRPAACLLALSVAVKPIALVMVCLALLLYRQVWWPVALALIISLLIPFATADPTYVLGQYGESLRHLMVKSGVLEHIFADINGMLRSVGAGLSSEVSQFVRVAAAGLTALGLLFAGVRVTGEPERAWLLLGVTAAYLMLFNPMTEQNSYAIAAPCIAVYASRLLAEHGGSRLGWSLVVMGVSIGIFPELFRRLDPNFGLWWKPLMMIFFSGFLVRRVVLSGRTQHSGAGGREG